MTSPENAGNANAQSTDLDRLDRKVTKVSARSRWTYVVVTVILILFATFLQYQSVQDREKFEHFERQTIGNCEQSNAQAAKFNAELDQLATNARNTKGLTAAQKAQALDAYSHLHLAIVQCPPNPR